MEGREALDDLAAGAAEVLGVEIEVVEVEELSTGQVEDGLSVAGDQGSPGLG